MMKFFRKTARLTAQRDEGWNFIEATFSVVLLSIVFLGFTISILATREWMERRWAIRLMDEYGQNIMVRADSLMREASSFSQLAPQNGLGAFRFYLIRFQQYPVIVSDSIAANFSAHPTAGVMFSRGNVSPRPFDVDFPSTSWSIGFKKDNKFRITQFQLVPSNDPNRPPYFNNSYATILLTIRYERPRVTYSAFGGSTNTYRLEKTYTTSVFMKNNINRASSN